VRSGGWPGKVAEAKTAEARQSKRHLPGSTRSPSTAESRPDRLLAWQRQSDPFHRYSNWQISCFFLSSTPRTPAELTLFTPGNAMTDDPCRRFFLEPAELLHRRYEVLRAFFVEGRPQADIARQFSMSAATVQSVVRDFRAQVKAGNVSPFFDSPNSDAPQPGPSR